MQTLISFPCFIRGVEQENPPLAPQHFEQANTILHRLRERKIPFVLCQHKHFNLRLSLLSKQQIFSEAQRDGGNTCGSFNLTLISKGTVRSAWPPCFCQSARACISQEEGKGERGSGASADKQPPGPAVTFLLQSLLRLLDVADFLELCCARTEAHSETVTARLLPVVAQETLLNTV